MARVGILTLSDGRDFVRRDTDAYANDTASRIRDRLSADGHEVWLGDGPIGSNESAVRNGRALAAWRPDLTIFSYPVWAFPHFTMLAAEATRGPLLLFSNLDPKYPGMVGMLAAAGGLEQVGRQYDRLWGDPGDPSVGDKLLKFVRAAHAVRSLEGTTFGRVGGRSMGMYTAVESTDRWISKFGIDVEEIDQWEIVRRSASVEASRVTAAREWLERLATVHYDGDRLTPELLERQIRSYYAMRELIDEWHLDFSGIKGQPELTTHFCTTDIAEAFLNDPYDWDGPKPVHVCATEVDMDGALTMQLFHLLTGTPALFADVRHYHADRDIWDLCNSGQHATWFAERSDDPEVNLRRVHLYPADFYFPAGGASVHHLAAPGTFTFGRLTRARDQYRMHLLRGSLERYDESTNEKLMAQSTYTWPHAFARFEASGEEVLRRFGANHIHAIPGDHLDEVRMVCSMLGIAVDEIG
jgi:L-fucose isomerase